MVTPSTPTESFDVWKALPIAISLIALVLPGIIALYRRFLRRRCLTFVKAARPEIGFAGPFGTTFAMYGAIYSGRRSSLVTVMTALLRHKMSGEVRKYKWHLARDPRISFSGANITFTTEIAGPFKIDEGDVAQFSTVFIDFGAFHDIDAVAPKVRDAWQVFLIPNMLAILREIGPRPTEPQAAALHDVASNSKINEAWSMFCQREDVKAYAEQLESLCWWQAGDYDVVLEATIEGAGKYRSQPFVFALQPTDVSQLRANVGPMLRTMAGMITQPYYAYPEFTET